MSSLRQPRKSPGLKFFSRLALALSLLAGLLNLSPAMPARVAPIEDGADAVLVLGQPGFTSNGNGVTSTAMYNPSSVAVDPLTGKVFVTDKMNSRVLRFASFAALSNGAAAEGVLGQADFTHGAANRGGSVAANTLNNPYSVAVDASGRLWVADNENSRVLRFDAAASKENGAPADGVLGQADFTGHVSNRGGNVDANTINSPDGVAVGASGRLWVADTGNSRVLRFEAAAAKENGAPADAVLGQADFIHGSTNRGGSVAANTFYWPCDVAVDSSGRLWVGDTANNRLLRFDAAAAKENGAPADAVLGQADFTHNIANRSGSPAANTLSSPYGVVVDTSGRLWVVDYLNQRVLRFDAAAAKGDGAAADGVLGQADFTHNSKNRGGSPAANTLNFPLGIAVDPTGRLWMADYKNNRVMAYDISYKLYMPAIFGIELFRR